MANQNNSTEILESELKWFKQEFERRCKSKEEDIRYIKEVQVPEIITEEIKPILLRLRIVEAWQNRLIGYGLCFIALAGLLSGGLKWVG